MSPTKFPENLILRFGLATIGLFCWDSATAVIGSSSATIQLSVLFFCLGLFLLGFAFFFIAAQRQPNPRSTWAILAAALLIFGAQWLLRIPGQDGIPGTTDVWMFSDYSAQLLRAGHNPYAADMLGSLWVKRSAVQFTTPLLNGDLGSKFPYPALAFLMFMPFQALGISTQAIYPVFYGATFVLVFFSAPPQWRSVAVLPLLMEARFSDYSFGGVNDIMWAFFLILMICTWHRPRQRAIWFGIACALKQQPWLLLPFLLIRLWHESREPQATKGANLTNSIHARRRWSVPLEFMVISGAVFLVFNAPFIVWNAQVWVSNIASVFTDNMILLGNGLNILTLRGVILIPKAGFLTFMLAVYLVALYLYWRHFHQWQEALWIVPGLALWFGHRSLDNYWYFFALPFFVALLRSQPEDQLQVAPTDSQLLAVQGGSPVPFLPNRFSRLLVAGLAGLIIVGLVVLKVRPAPLSLEVQQPIRLDSGSVDKLQVKVVNQGAATLTPRFSVKDGSDQPYFWHIDQGSVKLDPGETGIYSLSPLPGVYGFGEENGAQVIVTDARTDDLRASVLIPPDRASLFYDPIPNGDFTYWNNDLQAPSHWELAAPDGVTFPVQLIIGSQEVPQGPSQHILQFNLPPVEVSTGWNAVTLGTSIPFPRGPIQVWVKPPLAANPANIGQNVQSSRPDSAYGLELAPNGASTRVWVMFGSKEGHGQLEPDLYYWLIKAPIETWSLQSIDVQQIFDDLGLLNSASIPLLSNDRFGLPYPTRMLNFRLMLAGRDQTQPLIAEFGPVHSDDLFPNAENITMETLAHSDEVSVWHGQYVAAAGNPELAQQFFQQALDVNSQSADAYHGFGETSLSLQHWNAAVTAFHQALQNSDTHLASAYDGLGKAYEELGNYEQAVYAYQQALQTFVNAAPDDPFGNTSRDIYGDANVGLGIALVKQRQCTLAEPFLQQGLTYLPGDSRAVTALRACHIQEAF